MANIRADRLVNKAAASLGITAQKIHKIKSVEEAMKLNTQTQQLILIIQQRNRFLPNAREKGHAVNLQPESCISPNDGATYVKGHDFWYQTEELNEAMIKAQTSKDFAGWLLERKIE